MNSRQATGARSSAQHKAIENTPTGNCAQTTNTSTQKNSSHASTVPKKSQNRPHQTIISQPRANLTQHQPTTTNDINQK